MNNAGYFLRIISICQRSRLLILKIGWSAIRPVLPTLFSR
jgi:hypothetical protein